MTVCSVLFSQADPADDEENGDGDDGEDDDDDEGGPGSNEDGVYVFENEDGTFVDEEGNPIEPYEDAPDDYPSDEDAGDIPGQDYNYSPGVSSFCRACSVQHVSLFMYFATAISWKPLLLSAILVMLSFRAMSCDFCVV